MASANTIGRIVGQSPECEAETEESNPLAKIKEIFDQAKELYDKIKEMVEGFEQLAEARREADSPAPAEEPANSEASTEPTSAAPLRTTEDLVDGLAALGDALRVRPGAMEGPPRPDQADTWRITAAIAEEALRLSDAPGAAVNALDLVHLGERITELAATAPTLEQGAQAIDNASTLARMRGAKPQILQQIQKVFEVVQSAMKLAKGLAPQSDGAQIKE